MQEVKSVQRRKGIQDVFSPAYCEHDWKYIKNENNNKRSHGKEVMDKKCKKCGLSVRYNKQWRRSKHEYFYESIESMTWRREGAH